MACCSAIAHAPIGLFRPRRPDHRFLSSLIDAGLPRAQRTVDVRVLPQVAKSVPAAGLAEGVRNPRRVDAAMTAFVVEHPQARFVVDPGICRDVRQRAISELPTVLRPAVRPPADVVTTQDALVQTLPGVTLDFALPTHLHWDHVCGLLDLPTLPLTIHRAEFDWVASGPVSPVGGVRSSLTNRPITTYQLDGPPVATFSRSHDLFGDGTVVLVDLAGHTPGSIGILAATEMGPVLLSGDAAWHHAGIEQIRQRPSYPGALVDEDRDEAFRTLHRLHAVRDQMRIVPSHDHAAAIALRDHRAAVEAMRR
ncbi:MBL fold metallo-hydrolase [Mycobacterium sp. CBMA293]|nr:MBL fold metallo-hydrolase [Mycolicibacterium sp. CBMA 360]MUL56703.1 MBL fold metallo-hydrolase [Mycolicibacterium sp. CBMA 335]MUL69742.1 MBL fold metallo-hydrolase [Mycolicibacterium sp. CBMA 311]MUL91790.1 MBL fold metallo-hydrolase [Mycolicibacterium sp. CBMA 230]MUM10646.1 MBL fold metallo-hydrolase [Mycolicibacterium sp. CBMA 293]